LNIKARPGLKTDGSFAWRDWFNGQGDQLNSVGKVFPPIERTHFSQPFLSRGDKEMVIGLSTPIFAPPEVNQDNLAMMAAVVGLRGAPLGGSWLAAAVLYPRGADKVVGVLYTPVALRDIHSWLDKVNINNGFAVLIDSRGHCLRHQEEKRIM